MAVCDLILDFGEVTGNGDMLCLGGVVDNLDLPEKTEPELRELRLLRSRLGFWLLERS